MDGWHPHFLKSTTDQDRSPVSMTCVPAMGLDPLERRLCPPARQQDRHQNGAAPEPRVGCTAKDLRNAWTIQQVCVSGRPQRHPLYRYPEALAAHSPECRAARRQNSRLTALLRFHCCGPWRKPLSGRSSPWSPRRLHYPALRAPCHAANPGFSQPHVRPACGTDAYCVLTAQEKRRTLTYMSFWLEVRNRDNGEVKLAKKLPDPSTRRVGPYTLSD